MKIINLILFLSITVQINAQDYFLKNNGPYNDKIMSPEEFLGYEIGFEHTRHDLIVAYLNYLSNNSDNAQIIEYGKSHEGRKLVMLTVSSSSNLNNIGEIQRIHLKYTNPENKRGYTRTPEQILEEAKKAAEAGATQILIQGGLNPDLKLDYYEKCLSLIRDNVDIWIHSLSPTEIEFIAAEENITIKECLIRLQAAGLQSLPGGGAEMLVDDIRKSISPKKTRSQAWLDLHDDAHSIGMKTTATMVYGFGETGAQRVEHLMKVRDQQDKSGGFTAFIPWSFSPNKTKLDCPRVMNGTDYLRMVAMARIILDNISHLQAGWVTEGPDVSQLALQFGADDYGGVLMTEEVVSATGLEYGVTEDQVVNMIREAGYVPAQRTTQYDTIRVYGDEEEPVGA